GQPRQPAGRGPFRSGPVPAHPTLAPAHAARPGRGGGMSTVFTTLPGHPHSVGAARHFVTACLRACPVGVPNEITEAVELVVSELVTNALHHTRTGTPGGTFSVRVET